LVHDLAAWLNSHKDDFAGGAAARALKPPSLDL
jgi:hypothetical protein